MLGSRLQKYSILGLTGVPKKARVKRFLAFLWEYYGIPARQNISCCTMEVQLVSSLLSNHKYNNVNVNANGGLKSIFVTI
jgi:hypothetical protein